MPSLVGRITWPYRDGETLSEASIAVRVSIALFPDLKDASIVHGDNSPPTHVDLEKVLSGRDSAGSDFPPKPYDRVVIPVSRFFVFISAAVSAPGSCSTRPYQT